MDIKDFILISGGMLIVLVVAHGFWIAYRAKREPYRIDIVPDLVSEDVDGRVSLMRDAVVPLC